MSHEIDESNGRPAIAYVGEKPWHGLGATMQVGQSIADWRKAAGLDWEAKSTPVMYQNGVMRTWDDRKVLYRSDTQAPLSVMAKGYNIVQPADILNLYAEVAKAGGFELEVAGALSEGRRIWALAKVSEGVMVIGKDRVKPYVLFGTSFDGTMATIAKFLATRVVCNNTIQIGLGENTHEVKINHSVKWTDKVAEQIRLNLGVVHNAYEQFMVEAKQLANRPMNAREADAFVALLMEPFFKPTDNPKARVKDVRDTAGYKRIMALFNGAAIGTEMAGQTRWGMLNAVTQLIDHERGRSDATRLESAWFGAGNALKTRAAEILEGEFTVAAE